MKKIDVVSSEIEAVGKIVKGYGGKEVISYTGGKDYRYDLEGNINDVIENLTRIRDEAFAKGFRHIYVDINAYDEYGSPSVEVRISGTRDKNEMELEFEKKTKEEMKAKKKAEEKAADEKERAEYERLKAKFEK